MLSEEEVAKIAKLARLELTDKEIEKMRKDLSGILEHFNSLKKIKGTLQPEAVLTGRGGGKTLRDDEAIPKTQ
jgi:aspartyl/glutamyl-tRNA(Asn/Gln) amidotransferase C subunit